MPVCYTLPSLVLDPVVPRSRRNKPAILLAQYCDSEVCTFSLRVPIKHRRTRNIYFGGFEPRKGYKPTGWRLKKSKKLTLELCFSLSSVLHSEWQVLTEPNFTVQIACCYLRSQGIINPGQDRNHIVVTLVLSRDLQISCHKTPSRGWDAAQIWITSLA